MKAEVEKGCSVLTKKGFAQEGAILQEKDFSSPETFKELCDNSGKVKVLEDPEPVILFEDFGDSALVFDSFFFTLLRPGGDLRHLRSEIRFRIEELFYENNIVIAFPQRDVHLDTPHPIDVRVVQYEP